MALYQDTTPSYHDELIHDLATGLTYEDFRKRYGINVIDANRIVRDLPVEFKRRKSDGDRMWVLGESFEELSEFLDSARSGI